jgi:translocation and assembly module TamB
MVRRVGLALGAALGLILLLIGAAFAFAQTGPGQRVIGAVLEHALAGPQTTVDVEGLGGFVPFDLHLARLTVADPQGVWIELGGLHLSWSPRALLHGRIKVIELGADQIKLLRLPPTTSNEPFRLPELPSALPPIVVDRLAVPQIELGPAVLGEPATFSLAGRLAGSDDGRAVVLALDAERVDQRTASAKLDARLTLDPAALNLTLDAAETGGLLARLSDRPDAGNFSLHLKGSGPLDAWSGDLQLDAERLARADARLQVALTGQPKVHLDGSLQPASGLLPDQVAGLVGERLGLMLTVTEPAAQRLSLSGLRVTTASGDITGRAELDFERNQISAAADLDVPRLSPFGLLLQTPLAGALSAHLTADGALLQPKGQLTLTVDRPVVGQIAAERLATALDFTMPKPEALEVSATGRLTSLRPPPDMRLPTQDVTWRLALTGPAGGPLTLSELTLNANDLMLHGSGTLDPTTLAGQAKLALQASALGPLTAPFGQRLDGRANLAADLDIGAGARRIAIDLTGRVQDLAGVPPGAAELIGSDPKLAAQATLEQGRRIAIDSLTVTGAAATLGGDLALALPDQTLAGKVTLALPKLAVLTPGLGQDLAGALEITVVPGGSLAAPTALLKAHGQNLMVSGRPIESLALETSAKDLLTAPAGTLEVAARASGLEAKLVTGYRLEERVLKLSDLQLTGPRSRIGGDLTIDLERRLARGELKGEVGELAAFAPALPVPLRGQLKLNARLDSASERQSVAVNLDASDLLSDFGRLRGGHLRATVADALGTPSIDGTLELNAFRQDQIALQHAQLTAKGPPTELALTLSAQGKTPQSLQLDARARLSLGEPVRLRVEQLAGKLAGAPLRLAQPAELTIGADTSKLSGLDLRFGDAKLTASADLGARTVAADARVDGLPLALLSRFGGPAMTGKANAALRLQGPADDPRGSLDLSATGLRSNDLTFAQLPAADLTVRAKLAQQRLTIDARGRGVSKQPMTLSAALPLVVRFDRREFALPQDGGLSGHLKADLALARLAGLAGLDDQTLSGDLSLDLNLDGTLEAPGIQGTITVKDGGYANGTTGTVLRAIALRARADGRQLVIQQLSATDGGSGSLSGSGKITIDPVAHFPLSLQAELKQARLVRRDDADATISGKLQLQGNLAQLKLEGGLTVDRAQIRIPDSTGPDIAVIPVKEVGDRRAQPVAPAATGSALALALDLKIDLPGETFVSGRGLESEWQGQLQVTGSADNPVLVGTLKVRRGYVDLVSQRLNLTKGVISFNGATPPDPMVDVEATAQKADFTAIVQIQGQARHPTLTLTSQPPLPQDEILSRLLFNRDSTSITPAQAAQLAFALNRLRGGGLDVMGRLRSILHVDTLDVTSSTSNNTDGSATTDETVRAGKYLNNDVYLELQKGVAAQSGKARVEVQILPNVSLQAETSENAQGGIGLQWRYDY